jgi:hypothetical protein
MNHPRLTAHQHPDDGFVLCPSCHRGRWVVGTADGEFHLLDLGRAWHVRLELDGDSTVPSVAWLHDFNRVPLGGTLAMQISPMGLDEPARTVRTRAVWSVESVGDMPVFTRACWRRGVVPFELIESAAALAVVAEAGSVV